VFEQFSLTEYRQIVANYEHYLTMMIFLSLPLIFAILYFSDLKRSALQIQLKLWHILLIGIVLRIPLFGQSFWYDETFTSAVVQIDSWSGFFTAIQGDVHPPVYYLIVRLFVMVFGHTEIVMRTPAMLSGLALIASMYHIGKHYGGKQVAIWTALLTAILPTALYYSVEARYPALLALMLSLAYLSILERRAWLFALSLSIAAQLHINAWFYVVILLAIWILYHRKFLVAVLPVVSILSWLPIALNQASDVKNGFWITQSYPWSFIMDMTIGVRGSSPWSAAIPIIIFISVLGVALWLWKKQVDLLWVGIVVAVPLSQWFVGVVWHPIYLPRTLLFSALLLTIPMAWFLSNYTMKPLLIAGGVAVLVSIFNLNLLDRAVNGDVAIMLCADYSVIYATNVNVAVRARHYNGDARIVVYSHGNSTAQQLTLSAQKAMFDDVNDIFEIQDDDICIVSRVNMYNTEIEMNHLQEIAQVFGDPIRIEESDTTYYLIWRS
jgi:4-amino-4-deoxy-L-arabinose transferase-like glycosyltransferase